MNMPSPQASFPGPPPVPSPHATTRSSAGWALLENILVRVIFLFALYHFWLTLNRGD